MPAVVQGWFSGSESGKAIASVLAGDVNPSGRLPFTWYASLNDCGAHALNTYPGTWRADHKIIDEEYREDIFVGYRWTDLPARTLRKQFNVGPARVLFPFGHGLSYTTFQIVQVQADKRELTPADRISFTVSVQNTGQRAGQTTLQLYVSDKKCSVPRPVKELKAFQKVMLQPGERRDVTLTLDQQALSFYDAQQQRWVAEPGDFEALIGFSAGDIVSRQAFRLK